MKHSEESLIYDIVSTSSESQSSLKRDEQELTTPIEDN